MACRKYSFESLLRLKPLVADPSPAVLRLTRELGLPPRLPPPTDAPDAVEPTACSTTAAEPLRSTVGSFGSRAAKKQATPTVVMQRTLNRLTADKYDVLLAELREAHLEAIVANKAEVATLAAVMFNTAMKAPCALDVYARLCRDLYLEQTVFGVQFRYAVLQCCQAEFERSLKEEGDVDSPTRQRAFTNVQFAASLYLSGVLAVSTVVKAILPSMLDGGDVGLELLCAMLSKIGPHLSGESPQCMATILAALGRRAPQTSCVRVGIRIADILSMADQWEAATPAVPPTTPEKTTAVKTAPVDHTHQAASTSTTPKPASAPNVGGTEAASRRAETNTTSEPRTTSQSHTQGIPRTGFETSSAPSRPGPPTTAQPQRVGGSTGGGSAAVFCDAWEQHEGDVAGMLDDGNIVKEFRVPRRARGADACVDRIDNREAHLCEDGVWVSVNWQRRRFDVWHPTYGAWITYHKQNHRYKMTPCRSYEDPSRCAYYGKGTCDFLHRGERPHTMLENILREDHPEMITPCKARGPCHVAARQDVVSLDPPGTALAMVEPPGVGGEAGDTDSLKSYVVDPPASTQAPNTSKEFQ